MNFPSHNSRSNQLIPSSFLSSPIVTVVTRNRTKDHLKAHKVILEKSPVIKAILSNALKDREPYTIELPYDNYDLVDCLLQYLYFGDFDYNYRFLTCLETLMDNKSASFGAQLYVLAQRYEVPVLQEAVSRILVLPCRNKLLAPTIFESAQYIYANTPQSDIIFREHFTSAMLRTFKELGTTNLGVLAAEISAAMMDGGQVAVDIFKVHRQALIQIHPTDNDGDLTPNSSIASSSGKRETCDQGP